MKSSPVCSIPLSISVPILFAVALISAGCGGGERKPAGSEAAVYLPVRFDEAGLERLSEVHVYHDTALWEYIDGGAELYHQYDFVEVATADYTSGTQEYVLDIYKFADPDNAFGLFSAMRPERAKPVPLGVAGFMSESSLDFVKDRYLVRMVAFEQTDSTAATLRIAAQQLDREIGGVSSLPQKFSLFPSQQAVPQSERIDAGSFLGQGFLNDVYSRDYAVEGDTIKLFLTTHLPAASLVQWSSEVAGQEVEPALVQDLPFEPGGILSFRDSYYGQIIAGVKDSLLAGAVGDGQNAVLLLREWLSDQPSSSGD
jgi:hypothetical protein